MKRIILAVLLVAVLAIPAAASQLDVFKQLSDGSWSAALDQQLVTELARAWKHGEDGGYCNQETWEIPITMKASIAQWIDWDITGTGWEWQVRKPGVFAADCTEFLIASNDDVEITFAGFGDLYNQVDDCYLATSYAVGGQTPPVGGWVRADDLNNEVITLDYEKIKLGSDGVSRFSTKLWNKVEVTSWTRACEYEAGGTVTIRALDFKSAWLDPETGWFLTGTAPDPQ